MKKPVLTGIVVIIAIIIGISTIIVQGIDDVKINDIENSNIYSEKIVITTTTNVITDLVENIGGDHVSVTGLMGPGIDPHLYRPSASDVKSLPVSYTHLTLPTTPYV